MASHKEAKAKSETTATPAGRLEQPPAERLAQSIRDLIQEELPEGLRAAVSGPLPSWKDAIWVGVVVADAILLITQVPERIFKNTSFEFASNLVGYVFGGVLLVYIVLGTRTDHEVHTDRLVPCGACQSSRVAAVFAGPPIFYPSADTADRVKTSCRWRPSARQVWIGPEPVIRLARCGSSRAGQNF